MFRSLKGKAEATLRWRKSSKTSTPELPIVPSEAEASQLRFQEELASEDEQDRDPPTPKHVPFSGASVATSNILSSNSARYGRVNPAILGGFGGDDESIWPVDDEETDEEANAADRVTTAPDYPYSYPPMGQPGPSNEQGPRLGSAYQANSDLPSDSSITTTPLTQTRQVGYGSVSSSILAEFDSRQGPETPPSPPAAHEVETVLDGSMSTNPYVAFCEQQDLAMTVAYLRRLGQCADNEGEPADDFSFGQRYFKATDTTDIVVTHQRIPAEHLSGERDCVICTEIKEVALFPRFSLTSTCKHAPSTCLDCVSVSIKCDLDNRLWTEIRCPECKELLEYADIQRFAGTATFIRYETLALRAAMSEAANFVWCTSGCGSGQIHESGREEPIVTCLHCGHHSCFQHNVSWHDKLTCDEYDRLLADPENFRSRIEMEDEELSQAQRAQVDADRAMAQGLRAEDQAETRRRQERCREERERAIKAAALARHIMARRQREERQSRETVSKTTKPCPGCGWAIEKNEGCSHMTCISCRHQFCYECGADHGQILARDNSAHKEGCRFHPSQRPGDGDGGYGGRDADP